MAMAMAPQQTDELCPQSARPPQSSAAAVRVLSLTIECHCTLHCRSQYESEQQQPPAAVAAHGAGGDGRSVRLSSPMINEQRRRPDEFTVGRRAAGCAESSGVAQRHANGGCRSGVAAVAEGAEWRHGGVMAATLFELGSCGRAIAPCTSITIRSRTPCGDCSYTMLHTHRSGNHA